MAGVAAVIAWWQRFWRWLGDATETSHREQRAWAADPSTLDTYTKPDEPRHRKDRS